MTTTTNKQTNKQTSYLAIAAACGSGGVARAVPLTDRTLGILLGLGAGLDGAQQRAHGLLSGGDP